MDIDFGQTSTLRWSSDHVTSCTATSSDHSWEGSVATQGSLDVTPINTTEYRIFCVDNYGQQSDTAYAKVTVQVVLPQIDFTADPTWIHPGNQSTLHWTVSNAATCTASSTDAAWSGDVAPDSGTQNVSPPVTTGYDLRCVSAQGVQASASLSLTVVGASCNNGFLDAGEACDEGLNNGFCPAHCSIGCTVNNCAPPRVPVNCADPVAICKNSCDPVNESQVGFCNNNTSKCCVPQAAPVDNQSTSVTNPLGFDTVQGVLDQTLGSLRAIIGILAIIAIVIGGILYVTAGGDEGRIKLAKGAITAALIGLALGVAAPSFLKQIGDILGWGAIPAPVSKTLAEIATSTLNFLLSIVGILGVIMLVVGGLLYLTSAGDEDRIATGKKIVQYSIMGIAISLAALVIVTQIATFFSGA